MTSPTRTCALRTTRPRRTGCAATGASPSSPSTARAQRREPGSRRRASPPTRRRSSAPPRPMQRPPLRPRTRLPLEAAGSDADFADRPGTTDLSAFSTVLKDLGAAFARARSDGRVLSGFATHEVRTTYLGSSAGTRRRYVQPTGSIELVARTADGSASSWAGVGTADFQDVSLAAMDDRLVGRLAWARRSVELEAGRYEVILPPDAVADLVLELDFAASGREAEDGGSVFSGPDGRHARRRAPHRPFFRSLRRPGEPRA